MTIEEQVLVGVDLGGTKILAGRLQGKEIVEKAKNLVPRGNSDEVIEEIFKTIDQIITKEVKGIGIGVPSIVDIERGIVYDVQNIPSWKEVHLKEAIKNRYALPVYINNDANCFAAGVKHFGEGRNHENFVALIIGTGIAAGIIIDNKLYNGSNCGAGEFGMIPYLDKHFEYYCSGQFFDHVHDTTGEKQFKLALKGDRTALDKWREFGTHVGNAIKTILYAIDPPVIILGGSVSRAYPLFEKAIWKSLEDFAYRKVPERLKIKIASNQDIALLGAAALYYNEMNARMSFSP